jgi:hypothetical protein
MRRDKVIIDQRSQAICRTRITPPAEASDIKEELLDSQAVGGARVRNEKRRTDGTSNSAIDGKYAVSKATGVAILGDSELCPAPKSETLVQTRQLPFRGRLS